MVKYFDKNKSLKWKKLPSGGASGMFSNSRIDCSLTERRFDCLFLCSAVLCGLLGKSQRIRNCLVQNVVPKIA